MKIPFAIYKETKSLLKKHNKNPESNNSKKYQRSN